MTLEIVPAKRCYGVAARLGPAASVRLIGVRLRQPLIVSFIAVGMPGRPSVTDLACSADRTGCRLVVRSL